MVVQSVMRLRHIYKYKTYETLTNLAKVSYCKIWSVFENYKYISIIISNI